MDFRPAKGLLDGGISHGLESYVEEKGRAPSREKAQKMRPVPVGKDYQLRMWKSGRRSHTQLRANHAGPNGNPKHKCYSKSTAD